MLSNIEKETIILFNEAERTASVYTYNVALIKKLTQLCDERPDEVTFDRANGHGAMDFTIPKKLIKVTASRILSPEEKEIRAQSAQRAREARLKKV